MGTHDVFLDLETEIRMVRRPREKLDVAGSVLYAVAVSLIMYGLSMLPANESLWELVAGLVLIVAFIKWELHVAQPVFNVELFAGNRAFAFSSLAALINYSATFAVTFLLSLYLQYIREFDPRTAGLILMAQPIMMAVFSPFAGKLSDRIETRKVASIGMAVTAASLFGLTFLGYNTPMAYIVGDLLLLGFGFALFSSPNMNAIMSSVEPRFYGLASGAVSSMRLLGQMVSMGLATLVFSLYIGRVKIPPSTIRPSSKASTRRSQFSQLSVHWESLRRWLGAADWLPKKRKPWLVGISRSRSNHMSHSPAKMRVSFRTRKIEISVGLTVGTGVPRIKSGAGSAVQKSGGRDARRYKRAQQAAPLPRPFCFFDCEKVLARARYRAHSPMMPRVSSPNRCRARKLTTCVTYSSGCSS